MPSLRSGAQVNNNEVTAVNNSGGGVVEEVTNDEGSPERQVSPSEVQYSSRTSINDIQNNGCCSESSISIAADTTANTLSSLHNNDKDVNSNANQSITVKTTGIKNKNNEGTPTFDSKLSANEQGTGINDADIIKSYVSSLVQSINDKTAVGDIIWKELLRFPLRQFNEILREVDAVDCLEDLALVIYGENGYVTTRGGYAQGMDGNYDPVVALLGQFETSYKRDNGLIPPSDDDDDEEGDDDIEKDGEEMDEDELDGDDNGDVDFTFTNSRGDIDMDDANKDNAAYSADMFDAQLMVAKAIGSGMKYVYGQQGGSGDCVNRGGGIISPVPNSDGEESVDWGTLPGVGIDGMGSSDDEESITSDDEERPTPRRRKACVDEDDDFEWVDISKSHQPQQWEEEIVQSLRQDELLQKYSTSNQIPSHELYEVVPEEEMMDYMAERAKSSMSTCTSCNNTIAQGSIRVGILDMATGRYRSYRHLDCFLRDVPVELLDGTVVLGVADDVTSYTTGEDDAMSVEKEQATAAASDPSPPIADEEKAPVPLRRCKRKRGKSRAASKSPQHSKRKRTKAEVAVDLGSVPLPSQPRTTRFDSSRTTRSDSSKGRAASTAVQQPSGSRALSFKKKTPFTGEAVYITGRPDKFRNKSIVQDIAKKMGAILAKGASGQVKILIVLPKAPGKGTRDKCTNATERSEAYLIQSAREAVTNFPPGSTADEQLDLLIQDVSTQPPSSLTGQTITERKKSRRIRPGEIWNQCTNTSVDPSLKGSDMNQPGSGWAKQARPCCSCNFILTSEEKEQGLKLNSEGMFPPRKFERLPLSRPSYRSICIVKECFQSLVDYSNGNRVTCLHGCCLKHTNKYGEEGPPEIMKRSKRYQLKHLQVEESVVTTAHGIKQVSTRRRLSDGDPWSEVEDKYYDTSRKNNGSPMRICIHHGSNFRKCPFGCNPCEHGVNNPRITCIECYPGLKCRTYQCDFIRRSYAIDDSNGLCVRCIASQNRIMPIEQLNLKHLRELGHNLQTGSRHATLSYYIDGTMEGESHFNELNWENDEGSLKEGHSSLSHYPTNAHHQRMEDIHNAKSDLSKGSAWLRMNSANRRSLDTYQKVQNHITASRLEFYKTATAEDAGADNVIEFHDYSLESRHVQQSLNMWWNNGKMDGTFLVRVFKQVSGLDVNTNDFNVTQAFVEVKYKRRSSDGVWVEK